MITVCLFILTVFLICLLVNRWSRIAGLRGCTADVVILEEAAFIKEQIFWQIVTPLMGVKDTAVLAISTPDDEFNYYSELVNMNIFKVIYLGKECKACTDAGIRCIHRKLPVWKTAGRQTKIEGFVKDKALLDRETRGIINTGKQFLFEKMWIHAFMGREPYKFNYPVQVIHTAIDPAGGGQSSDYAIGSMSMENSMKVVSFFFFYISE